MTALDQLRVFIEHAPPHQDLPDSPLIGIRGEGFVICRSCLSRIQRRGCSIPVPNQLIWQDEGTMVEVDCDLKAYHQEPL